MIAVAVAVAAVVGPEVIGVAANAATGAGATGLTAVLGASGAAVVGGAITGAVASIASQVVGVATGIQDKFSWKGVALAAIGGAIGGAMPSGDLISGAGKFANDFARGALANVATQGVSVATGLQHKFDWTGVAAAGVVSGVGGAVERFARSQGLNTWTLSNDTPLNPTEYAIGGAIKGMAGGIAGAATRSIIDGTDFGDNLMAVLPDVIGTTIGSTIGSALTARSDPRMDEVRADLAAQGGYTSQAGGIAPMDLSQMSHTFEDSAISLDASQGFRAAATLSNFAPHGDFLNDAVYRTIDGIPVDQFGNPLDVENLSVGYKTRFSIDILNEDKVGGHTYQFHVGKSDDFMRRRLSTPLASSPNGIQIFLTETSTFTSLSSANRLINATLSMKAYEVDDFLRGTDNSKFITAYFSSPTGRTMYSTAPVVSRNRSPGSFVTETTYGVGVVIQRAPYLQNGFYVKTSYPIGLDKISPFKQ